MPSSASSSFKCPRQEGRLYASTLTPSPPYDQSIEPGRGDWAATIQLEVRLDSSSQTPYPSLNDFRSRERTHGGRWWSRGRRSSGSRCERSQTEPTDLNVPFRLECEPVGRERWSTLAS
jgi:hypothetical protein